MSLLQNSNAISTGGYNLEDSLRFRSSASAYLNRTPGSAGNRRTWTWSAWVKRGTLNTGAQALFASTNNNRILFGQADSNDDFGISDGNTSTMDVVTTQVFRDPSAWYHLVVAFDTTQATAANRVKLYVNGTQITTLSRSTYPTQNAEFNINNNTEHNIGRWQAGGQYFDGYMIEVNFVDGQALTPSDFGETDTVTGVWKPKKYTGTYGTNGFYLDMSTSGSTVTDQSGNSNNWTANNMNLTTSTATTYDIMSDVPILTDEDTANFSVLNPLIGAGSVTVSLANLKSTAGTNAQRSNVSTISVSSGKYYWETTWNQVGANDAAMTGIIGVANLNPNSNFGGTNSYAYVQDGGKQGAGSYTGSYGDRYVAGDVIGTALDLDGGTITFYRNGVSQGTAFSSLPSVEYHLGCSFYNSGDNFDINFGQRPFAYTPPTGYKKLNTYNLPDSTIVDGSENFNTVLYTGNGASSHAITGVGFKPDFVWYKHRNHPTAHSHNLTDVARGVTKLLYTNTLDGEETITNSLLSFNTDGFTVGNTAAANTNGINYVSWNWKAGGTTVSNTAGTIASQVSANPTAGFSIVTYTGDGSNANRTVGHGLGVAPEMVIVKTRSEAGRHWVIWHKDLTNYDYGLLFNTDAAAANRFGPNAPTSSVFGVYGGQNNRGTQTFVAYCFASVEGYSKFGSYTGNGSTDGTFVYTGFRPAFILWKRTDAAGNSWRIKDSTRNPYNETLLNLFPNSPGAENSDTSVDFVSNGFKNRSTGVNASSATYIYMAFAENPFKNSLAR